MKEEKQSLVAADKLGAVDMAEILSVPGDRRRLSLMLVVTGALIFCFAVPLISFFEHAAISDLHSYILLIPFVAGYVFWTKRKILPRHYTASPIAAVCSVLLGFAFLGLAATAHGVGVISDNDLLSLVASSFVSFLTAAGFCFLGRRWMTAAVFPFAFLVFMVPMPDGMVNALETASQHASAAAADLFFRFGNTPYIHEGMVFWLPNITLEVAQECSGIRSSWILFITSVLAANIFLGTTWKRILLVCFVIPLGILRNGFRVWVIGMLCVRFGPQMIDSPIHHQGGPLFFALSLVPLFLLLFGLRRGEDAKEAQSVAGAQRTA